MVWAKLNTTCFQERINIMRIFLPFNSKYFFNQYLDQNLLNKIQYEVIPDIIERHSQNEYVKNIDVFSDVDFSEMESFSNKVRYIQNNSYIDGNFIDLVESYVGLTPNKDEVFVYHNPLFPFISLEKVFAAFEFVKKNTNCILNAEFGTVSYSIGRQNVDVGAVSVFNFNTLKKLGSRSSKCNEFISMTALEMLCLRYSDDLEHYDLIINSGYKL